MKILETGRIGNYLELRGALLAARRGTPESRGKFEAMRHSLLDGMDVDMMERPGFDGEMEMRIYEYSTNLSHPYKFASEQAVKNAAFAVANFDMLRDEGWANEVSYPRLKRARVAMKAALRELINEEKEVSLGVNSAV